jgi:hypothetical protein
MWRSCSTTVVRIITRRGLLSGSVRLLSARMIMMTAPFGARVECCCEGLSQRPRLELQGYSEKTERIHGDH